MEIDFESIFRSVQNASRKLSVIKEETINKILHLLAEKTVENTSEILKANQLDLDLMDQSDPRYDRLKLTSQRLKDIATDLRNVASLPSPLGKVLEHHEASNGLLFKKISVPLGVIGVIYEARPNVTFDVFALCIKSGNACILKGGSDAEHSNTAIIRLIKDVLSTCQIDPDSVVLLPSDRIATSALLTATKFVDIIIPRGSQNLINYVRENAKVPVIETGAGIVHTYFHESGDAKKGADIIYNAKTRRVSVCNALDCLIIDRTRLDDLPLLTQRLQERNVRIYADDESYAILQRSYDNSLLEQATQKHFGTEFLDYKMSVKTVGNLEEALDHIQTYSSRHSEAIIAEDEHIIESFLKRVDAAAVYANASTAFTDGAQFGLGAEIGISTQKLHARGPMALREITSYKWIVRGNGSIRNP